MSASPTTASQPTRLTDQELAAVLDRFQNWTAARQASPPAPSAGSRPAVRELSYEEALRLARYRGSLPNLAEPKIESEARDGQGRPSQDALAAAGGGRPIPPAEGNTFLEELDQALTNLKGESARQQVTAPAVAKQSAREAPADQVPAPAAKLRRSVPLTVRVTAAEDAQIRAQAAAASLSVSDYLRTAVLEVERLRTQLAQSIEALHTAMAAAPPAEPRDVFTASTPPGRIARIFRRLRSAHCSLYT